MAQHASIQASSIQPPNFIIQDPDSRSFQSLSPNSKSLLISSSLSNLILSIATTLKTRNQANILLQSYNNNTNATNINRQTLSNQVIRDSLDFATHANLLKVKRDCETYLNRLTGLRDWLLHAQAALETELIKAKERESNPTSTTSSTKADSSLKSTTGNQDERETITIEDSDDDESNSKAKGKKKKTSTSNSNQTIDLTLDDDDNDGDQTKKPDSIQPTDSMDLDSSLFGGEDEDDSTVGNEESAAEKSTQNSGIDQDSNSAITVVNNDITAINSKSPTSAMLDSLASNLANSSDSNPSNPTINVPTSNDADSSQQAQPQIDFSTFDFGDLSSFADGLQQQQQQQQQNSSNNVTGENQGFDSNLNNMDLSNLDFSSFGDEFLNDGNLNNLSGNGNGEGVGGDGLAGFENVDLSSIFDGFTS